jgi:head-tail adaptor
MRAGPLRHRITIQESTTKSGGDFGSVKDTWSDVKTVYAQFRSVNANEMNEKEQTTGSVYTEFRIREPKGFEVTPSMRIVFKSKNYYITGVKPGNVGDDYLINAVLKDNG